MTVLITNRSAPRVPSGVRETDTRTALTRGLAEYLAGLTVDAKGGRRLRLRDRKKAPAPPTQEASARASGKGPFP